MACTLKEGLPGHVPPLVDVTQALSTISVPVFGAAPLPVFGTPLLTIFADLWSHESDTGLPAPTVSQLAFCLALASGA